MEIPCLWYPTQFWKKVFKLKSKILSESYSLDKADIYLYLIETKFLNTMKFKILSVLVIL